VSRVGPRRHLAALDRALHDDAVEREPFGPEAPVRRGQLIRVVDWRLALASGVVVWLGAALIYLYLSR
jgi:hypothetical protein